MRYECQHSENRVKYYFMICLHGNQKLKMQYQLHTRCYSPSSAEIFCLLKQNFKKEQGERHYFSAVCHHVYHHVISGSMASATHTVLKSSDKLTVNSFYPCI